MRKFHIVLFFLLFFTEVFSQNFQLHYDFRHSIDPDLNSRNFPTFSFEYFKLVDTVGTGSFLIKLQTNLSGENYNASQVFTQVSQTVKFWKPPVYIALSYIGGLGVGDNSFGFYIPNSYGLGASYPFQWLGGWVSTSLCLRYTSFEKSSFDPQFTLYFGKGFYNYRLFLAGSFVFWTENRNRGNAYTADLSGKKWAFFGDPQIWLKVYRKLSVGTRFNVFYNLLGNKNEAQVYPTFGIKYEFQ